MSPVEVIFIILGIALLLGSCFFTGKEKGTEKADNEFRLPEEFSEEQKKEIGKRLDQIIESRTEEIVVKTDDYLSKISNEKIMAVNDFTDQIMQRVDKNNEEIVFLYQRLTEKEDEIKATIQSMDDAKQEMKESIEDVIRLTRQLNSSIKKAEKNSPDKGSSTKPEKSSNNPTTKTEQDKNKDNVNTKKVIPTEHATGQMELPEMMQSDNKNEEIIKLYRQGKSVLEISKTLGLGQGEVKLVIGLYGIN